jgi:hypothetical protein
VKQSRTGCKPSFAHSRLPHSTQQPPSDRGFDQSTNEDSARLTGTVYAITGTELIAVRRGQADWRKAIGRHAPPCVLFAFTSNPADGRQGHAAPPPTHRR